MQQLDRSLFKNIRSGMINVQDSRCSSYEELREQLCEEISEIRMRVSQLAAHRSTFEGKEVVIVDSGEFDSLERQLISIDNRQSFEREIHSGICEHIEAKNRHSSELSELS